MARIVVASGMPSRVLDQSRASADLCLEWLLDEHNAVANVTGLLNCVSTEPPVLIRDLVDIALGVFLTDIAFQRGRNESWVRNFDMLIPVRNPAFWRENTLRLTSILHGLTGDNFALSFCSHDDRFPELLTPTAAVPPAADCVAALSGGIDSLAGAVMLMRTGRKPLFVMHQSGNPRVRTNQDRVVSALNDFSPGIGVFASTFIQPRAAAKVAYPFPPAPERENSRRSRAFLFMTLIAAAAAAIGVSEAYLCDNGILTVALPLSRGRIGAQSTRSTHPLILRDFNMLMQSAGVDVTVTNPFIYQTKAELINTIIRPVIPPDEILATVSCWMAGRKQRQCGGCIPCLLRRISLLAAGLPDEAYEMDVLAEPEAYRGTDAYTNLVDMLNQTGRIRRATDTELIMNWPELLDLASADVSATDVIAMYRRYADEVWSVVSEHFPATARLLE